MALRADSVPLGPFNGGVRYDIPVEEVAANELSDMENTRVGIGGNIEGRRGTASYQDVAVASSGETVTLLAQFNSDPSTTHVVRAYGTALQEYSGGSWNDIIGSGPALDPDAAAYISAVETADGQALEAAVVTAINAFVVGCKADGIWNAIKSSAILAGARTLSGALQPLAGTAPTNFNFVSGDYDRKTGLKGNGSTKYLNSNRNNNADPQNDRHVACYRSRAQNGNQTYIAARINSNVIGANYLWTAGAAPQFTCVPNIDAHTSNGSDTIGVATFHGVSRANSTTTTGRISGVNYSFSSTSATPISNNLRIFCGANNSIPEFFTNARISFYSIGESLDLALLDTRVSTLMTSIDGAIP